MPPPLFLNIAHRGARAFAPENTVQAIRMAQRLGANAVELDVQMSRDGELIVFHDDDLTRCSDAVHKYPLRTDYAVCAFAWDELQLLDVGRWYVQELTKAPRHRDRHLQDLKELEVRRWISPADADEYESGTVRIPRLRDALVAARECSLVAVLEIKTIPRRFPSIATKALDLVRDLGMQEHVLLTSFDHALLADIRRSDQAVATGVLTAERLHRPLDYVRVLDADAFHPSCTADADVLRRGVRPEELDTDAIETLVRAGIMVNVWTENAESRMRAFVDAGVTGIFTDYPNRLTDVLRAAGRTTPASPRLRGREAG